MGGAAPYSSSATWGPHVAVLMLFLVICMGALRSTSSQAHPSPVRPRPIASAVISQAYGSRRLQARAAGRLRVAPQLLGKLDEASGRQGRGLAEGDRERDGRLGVREAAERDARAPERRRLLLHDQRGALP